MTEQEFQSAVDEFLKNGGKVQELPYRKPEVSTFASKGVIASTGFSRSQVNGFAAVDALIR